MSSVDWYLLGSRGYPTSSEIPPSRRHERSVLARQGEREHSVVGHLGSDWWAHALVRERAGRLVVTQLEIWQRRGSEAKNGLSSRDLRELGLAGAAIAVEAEDKDLIRSLGHSLLLPSERARLASQEPSMRQLAKTHQGLSRGEDFYARMASAYLRMLHAQPLRPVAALSEELRKAGMSDATPVRVRSWINLARSKRYGFLSAGKPGYAGARPTAKLRRWREANETTVLALTASATAKSPKPRVRVSGKQR